MEKFSAFGREVKKINEGNADLIKAAQEVVSRSLQFLQRAMGEQANYNQGGQVSAQPLQGKIVSERG
jgi:flagellar biosynthesis/type III secretory pathway chaperone